MAVAPQRRDQIHILRPGAPPAGGIHIVSGADNDDNQIFVDTSEMPDGGLRIMYGSPEADEDADTGPDDKFDRNLAEDMDDYDLDSLASTLLMEIEADELSRRDWEETANLAALYLGVKLEDPTTSVSADGTICKSVATCMLEAALKLWGVWRAELLPVTGPVKVRQDRPPRPSAIEESEGAATQTPGAAPVPQPTTTGASAMGAPGGIAAAAAPAQPTESTADRDDLARALEMDMNHYLTVVDREYYPDTSRMLMSRAVVGVQFKKVYRDPLLRRPVSRWVKAQDLIINNTINHLGDGVRHTERIPTTQAKMRRLMVAGFYRDIPLSHPTARPSPTDLATAEIEGISAVSQLPSDYEHTVYECHREIGSGTASSLIGDIGKLDRDETGKKPGYPLPYTVSIDVDSRKILAIRRDWKKGNQDHRQRRRYVKFGMIPGLGGYYDWGLIHIVGNPTQAATMIQRAMTDSSLLANFPGGVFLKGPGSRQANTVIRPNPGEFLPMDAAGAQRIQDVLMPLPYKPPTPEVMALVEKLEGDVRRLSGVVEIPVGEGRLGNTPVGTIMSYIESVSQVPGAVSKDDHISQQDEFMLLRELFAEDPESLVRGVKRPARRWQIDDEIMEPDLVPAADPNTPSEVHRLLKVQGLVTLGGMPQFQGVADNRAIFAFATEALTGEQADEFMVPATAPAPPPPDPRIQAAEIKAQSDQMKVQAQQQTDQQKHDERLTELSLEDQQRAADRQSAETRAAMSLEAAKVKATHDTLNAAADRQHDTANAAADRQHEAVTAQADRQQADTHKAADLQHQTMAAGLTAADNQANRDQQAQLAAQPKSTEESS